MVPTFFSGRSLPFLTFSIILKKKKLKKICAEDLLLRNYYYVLRKGRIGTWIQVCVFFKANSS